MATTTQKWCSSWGANYYQTVVRKNGFPDYTFDTEGRDTIKTICQVNEQNDHDSVSNEIHDAAVRRGERYHNRMEVAKEHNNQRYHLKMMPTKNVQAVREYDKMYDIPGSHDLDREMYANRHAEHLKELDIYEAFQVPGNDDIDDGYSD